MKFFERRRKQAQLMILGALIGSGELSGLPIMERTGLSPGRAYVALAQLEKAGRVTSRWADGPYPRRRLYRFAFAKGGVIRPGEMEIGRRWPGDTDVFLRKGQA